MAHQAQGPQCLRRDFAKEVVEQATKVLAQWKNLHKNQWTLHDLLQMQSSAQRLLYYAQHFKQRLYVQIAERLLEVLNAIEEQGSRLNSYFIQTVTQLLQELLQTGVRQGEHLDQTFLPGVLPKPVYIALRCPKQAAELTEQLQIFGFQVDFFTDDIAFMQAVARCEPAVIILDIDFMVDGYGLQCALKVKNTLDTAVPLFFYSREEVDTAVQLAVVRAGGQAFASGILDIKVVLEKLKAWTALVHTKPYKVLVVDDCEAHTAITEQMLNTAGIITRATNQPIDALTQLFDFSPDLVILDMYMSDCTGPELAKVIRYHERFVSVPIIYLSAEYDVCTQLDAMSEGADDFLMIPVQSRHLVAVVRNRVSRARQLQLRIDSDSCGGQAAWWYSSV